MKQKNKIEVFQSAGELTEATARFIISIAQEAVDKRGRFVISLSGGHTPEQLYTLLATAPFRNQMPWNDTYIFWGDERCVPSDDKQNNANMAKILLLDHIDIPPTNIYPIPVDLRPADAASAYEQTIKDFFGNTFSCFDLMLLGLGENGHTASLFPGTDVLTKNGQLVRDVYVAEQSMSRITMTAQLINQSHNILFLVAGEGKAEILKIVLTAPYQPDKYPSQLIGPVHGDLYWFVDSKAAALLPDNV